MDSETKKTSAFLTKTFESFKKLNEDAEENVSSLDAVHSIKVAAFFSVAAENATVFHEAAQSEDPNILGLLIDIDTEFRKCANMDFFDVVEVYHHDENKHKKALALASRTLG